MKFSNDNGEVEVAVSLEATGQISLQVKDSGIGIKMKTCRVSFRPFNAWTPARLGNTRGTGLGLVLTKKMLEIQHGSIAVQSEAGKGSTFTVTIPREFQGKYSEFRRLQLRSW